MLFILTGLTLQLDGRSALYCASCAGDRECVKLLLKYGAQVDLAVRCDVQNGSRFEVFYVGKLGLQLNYSAPSPNVCIQYDLELSVCSQNSCRMSMATLPLLKHVMMDILKQQGYC